MDQQTIAIVGGGYAGLNAVEAVRKKFGANPGVRIILLDKEPHHFRKVLLVRAAAQPISMEVPFETYGWHDVEVRRGEATGLDPAACRLSYIVPGGKTETLVYDRLVLALGSAVREIDPARGGIALRDATSAAAVYEALTRAMDRARTAEPLERADLLRAVVAGGGISGIETAAELAHSLREGAAARGFAVPEAVVMLVNAAPRLLPQAPAKIGARLERRLARLGVRVLHGVKAERFRDGAVILADGRKLDAAVCVWTLGTTASPRARELGLPVHEDGRLRIDPWYRVQGHDTIYAIGDCAWAADPRTGKPDGMTCKEAIPHAHRLAAILQADLNGAYREAPGHQAHPPLFCIGLGPRQGFVWTQRWGIDFVLGGKLGQKVREFTWNMASLIN